ncbi:hypothetical protein LguiB_002785 [Lonicera macranthoides]
MAGGNRRPFLSGREAGFNSLSVKALFGDEKNGGLPNTEEETSMEKNGSFSKNVEVLIRMKSMWFGRLFSLIRLASNKRPTATGNVSTTVQPAQTACQTGQGKANIDGASEETPEDSHPAPREFAKAQCCQKIVLLMAEKKVTEALSVLGYIGVLLSVSVQLMDDLLFLLTSLWWIQLSPQYHSIIKMLKLAFILEFLDIAVSLGGMICSNSPRSFNGKLQYIMILSPIDNYNTFKFGLPWDSNGVYNDLNRRPPRTFDDILARINEFSRAEDNDQAANFKNVRDNPKNKKNHD